LAPLLGYALPVSQAFFSAALMVNNADSTAKTKKPEASMHVSWQMKQCIDC